MYEENTKETLKILVALKLPITKSPSRPPLRLSSCLPGSQMRTDAIIIIVMESNFVRLSQYSIHQEEQTRETIQSILLGHNWTPVC